VAEVAVPVAAAARPAGAAATTGTADAAGDGETETAAVAGAGALVAAGDGAAVAGSAAEPVERSRLDDFRGFGRRHPWPAALFAIFLLSLAGIPPLAGFWGKYYLFQAGINAGLAWLVVVAVVSSVISAFFYLRVIAVMYLDEPAGAATPVSRSRALGLAMAIAGVLTVAIGLAPQALVSAAQAAGRILG
jgi:NADH-quinone oxidoreductase subunit N